MKSFVPTVAFVLTAVGGGVVALPTGDATLARREGNLFFPWFINTPAAAANGPINVAGANGGYNYGGSGANGGSISVGKREEEFFFPLFNRPAPPAVNGAITASGANGGYNINGNGANGGRISIGRREPEEESKGFFWPLLWPSAPAAPANGPVDVNGANGGYNAYGNGANGGTISVGRREEDSKGFFWPLFWPSAPAAAANGPVSVSGANGGYNVNGNGANGGSISVNRREEDSKGFFWPLFWPSAPATQVNGPISVDGANGGYNFNGNGANGGSISVN